MINNKIIEAILDRSVVRIQDLVLEGEDLYYRDEHNRTYIELAVFLNAPELIEYFVNEGLEPSNQDDNLITPLHLACRFGYEKCVEQLLRSGASRNSAAERAITPLHIAAAFGHDKIINLFFDQRFVCSKDPTRVDPHDEDRNTPLTYAVAEGHKGAVKSLIDNYCDVYSANVRGNCPIHYAATLDSPDICATLLEVGFADIDVRNNDGLTALHFATQQANRDMVLFLLKQNADPNVQDGHGYTCSHLAIKHGRVEILNLLMTDPRTDSSICDREGDTVLHVALKTGHENLIPMMIPKAMDLTKQDANGNSVIIEAIRSQFEDLALEMLKICPSLVNTKTMELVTPLHLAAERGMKKLTRQLLISGAQVDAADAEGLTPSLYCAKNDSVLECLAMIEDIMMISDADDSEQQPLKNNNRNNNSKISSRISS